MSLDIQNSFADIFSSTYVAWRDVILNVDHCTDCRPSAYLLTLLLSRLSVKCAGKRVLKFGQHLMQLRGYES